jgi:NIMA-interacting peptidyl-prolyl cis-trans isomerase 1
MSRPQQSETGLPPNWEVRHSQSKNLPYYFNSAEKVSRWEPPSETNTEKLKRYMAEYHSNKSLAEGTGEDRQSGKIRAAHLLVKHRDSRRPSSWRENTITRTKEEAEAIIKAHEARIKGGEISLGDLALTESDCSSARKQGDLGFFGRGDMQKEFEDAAFALKAGEVSGIVDTASGLHLIQRFVLLRAGIWDVANLVLQARVSFP